MNVNETVKETHVETSASYTSQSSENHIEKESVHSVSDQELISESAPIQHDKYETSVETPAASVSYSDVSLDRIEGLLFVQVFFTAVIVGICFSNIFFKRGGG